MLQSLQQLMSHTEDFKVADRNALLGAKNNYLKTCESINLYLLKEDQMKRKLSKDIRDRKKTIYTSLTKTIEESMQDCYKGKRRSYNRQPVTKIVHTFIICDCA